MPEIRFINLPDPIRDRVVCQRANALFWEGHRVLIHTKDLQHTKKLDQQLWILDKTSFIPHSTFPCDESYQSILVDHQERPFTNVDVLLLANESSFEYMRQFPLIIDFAETYNLERRDQSRLRFRRWQEHGFSPQFEQS